MHGAGGRAESGLRAWDDGVWASGAFHALRDEVVVFGGLDDPFHAFAGLVGAAGDFIESFVEGIVILTDKQELLHINQCASRICQQLMPDSVDINMIPEEIWHVCQSLINSREVFPEEKISLKVKAYFVSSCIPASEHFPRMILMLC